MKITKADNVTVAQRKIVEKWVRKCLREITKKEHELMYGFDGSTVTYKLALNHIRVHCKGRGQSSTGGRDKVAIDIKSSIRWAASGYHDEYAAYRNDPVIGRADIGSLEEAIAFAVAHEVAHFIQFRYGFYTPWLKNTYLKPHGEAFKSIYYILRSRLVNPFIAQSQEAAA